MFLRLDIRLRCFSILVVMFVGLVLDYAHVPYSRLVGELTGIGMWITFMNVGSLAYFVREQYLQDGRVDPKLIKFCAFVIVAFIVGCLFMEHAPIGQAHYHNRDAAAFLGAFLVLVALLSLEHLLPKIRFLLFLGAISYPLYATHLLVGWYVFMLAFRTVGVTCAAFLSISVSLIVAYAIHLFFEAPLNKLGKETARDWKNYFGLVKEKAA